MSNAMRFGKQHPLSSFKIADSTAILPDQHQAKIVRCKYPFVDVPLDEVASGVDIEPRYWEHDMIFAGCPGGRVAVMIVTIVPDPTSVSSFR